MKEITIPESVTIVVPGEGPLVFSFKKYLDDEVFTLPQWRTGSLDAYEAWKACTAAFSQPESGDKVTLEDAVFEIFKPLAIQSGVKLAPHIVQALQPYFDAVYYAKNVGPTKKSEDN